MVHFLRNTNNRTIIECDVYKEDLHTSVDVKNYSMVLIDMHNHDRHYPFINDIDNLSEIRGLWWEREMDFGNWESIDKFVEAQYTEVAERYGLIYVTD